MSYFCPYCMRKATEPGKCSQCVCDLHRTYNGTLAHSPRKYKASRDPFRIGRYQNSLFGVGECAWCGTDDNLTIHHIHPLAKGGQNVKDNRLVLCVPHHRLIHNAPASATYRQLYSHEHA